MNEAFLQRNPGPFSSILLKEIKEEKKRQTKTRFDKTKKKDSIDKQMATSPNIDLVDSNANKNISIKPAMQKGVENIELINDSDSDSIATAEPQKSPESSPEPTPVKPKKSFTKMPTIDMDEFQYFTNNRKQKPVVQKNEVSEEETDDDSEVSEDDSDSDESAVSSSASEKSVKKPKMSAREIEKRKQDLLIKLIALEKKGVTLTKTYSLKSSLEEIEFEYETQRKSAEIEASVHFQQKILMAAVTGIEFLNKKFDPIGAKLEGWSESVMDNINDYEEIFKKLHEKYSQKTSMPPELQLLVTLVGSGFMFHLTQTLFKSSLPGLGDVLKTNPDIMNNIMGAMGKAMNNAHGITPPSADASVPMMPTGPVGPIGPVGPVGPLPSVPLPSGPTKQLPEFTGPSVNLSNLMNNYDSGPGYPKVQQAPKMKNEEQDRFSVASSSSSDYSEIEPTTKTVTVPTKKGGKNTPKGKTIKI